MVCSMGSGYLMAMEGSEMGFSTTYERGWDVVGEVSMFDTLHGEDSGDRSRVTYRISSDRGRCSVRTSVREMAS